MKDNRSLVEILNQFGMTLLAFYSFLAYRYGTMGFERFVIIMLCILVYFSIFVLDREEFDNSNDKEKEISNLLVKNVRLENMIVDLKEEHKDLREFVDNIVGEKEND